MSDVFDVDHLTPTFTDWTEQDYLDSDLRYCVPMTAHALETDEEQEAHLTSETNYIEEKFDGVRCIMHIRADLSRLFSRRISKKTNWFTENTDSLPHLKSVALPEYAGTVLDGELFIDGKPFKEVSAIMNCKWDEAVRRQHKLYEEGGYVITLHAFDILYYKGVRVERLPLYQRKHLLYDVWSTIIRECGTDLVDLVPYFTCGNGATCDLSSTHYRAPDLTDGAVCVTPREYYNLIVARGGEGVIIKDKNSKYVHKRDKAYLKIKKFYTREVVIVGFNPPSKYYEGKFPNDYWEYWEKPDGTLAYCPPGASAKSLVKSNNKPVTKFHYKNWVGTIVFGVVISDDEMKSLPKDKVFTFHNLTLPDGRYVRLLEVGETSGLDDEERERISHNTEDFIGKVIEVKCNEIFKDTGKLRHPRFLRYRDDKSVEDCTYHNHMTEGL